MLPNDFDFQVRKERQADLRCEAEHERLIATAKQTQPDDWYYARKLSVWLGEWMIQWGTYLVNLAYLEESVHKTKNGLT